MKHHLETRPVETVDLTVDDSDADTEIEKTPSPQAKKVKLVDFELSPASSGGNTSAFQNDPIHFIINDITSWTDDNLKVNKKIPIFRAPLSYDGTEKYERIMTNYIRREIQTLLRQKLINRAPMESRVIYFSREQRNSQYRYTIHCDVNKDDVVGKHDFLRIKLKNNETFFAFITEFLQRNDTSAKRITLESATKINLPTQLDKIEIISRTNIAKEIGMFQSAYFLRHNKFCTSILDPSQTENLFRLPIPKAHIMSRFYYKFFTKHQKEILAELYLGCFNAKNSENGFISLIDGVAGSGKSLMIVELVNQLIHREFIKKIPKILICTYHSESANNITAKILELISKFTKKERTRSINILRYGIVETDYPKVKEVTPYSILRQEKNCLPYVERVTKLYEKSNVICTTTRMIIELKKHISEFDIVIVDDASNCPELSTIIPLSFKPSSFILFGDKYSKSSAISIDPECHEKNLDQPLFFRIIENLSEYTHDFHQSFQLHEQFRMSPGVCHLVNELFYQNSIKMNIDDPTSSNVFRPFLVIDTKSSMSTDKSGSATINAQKMYDDFKALSSIHKYHFTIIFPTEVEVEDFKNYASIGDSYRHCLNADQCLNRETDILFIWITNQLKPSNILNETKYLQKIFSRVRKSIIICGDLSVVKNMDIWSTIIRKANEENAYKVLQNINNFVKNELTA